MRARFLTSIASVGFAYSAGTEVSVGGKTYGADCVPESVGRAWLASGVLELIGSVDTESAAIRSPERAAFAAARPRHSAVARK